MEMKTVTQKDDMGIARQLRKHLSGPSHKNGVIYQGKQKNGPLNKSGLGMSIMFKSMTM